MKNMLLATLSCTSPLLLGLLCLLILGVLLTLAVPFFTEESEIPSSN